MPASLKELQKEKKLFADLFARCRRSGYEKQKRKTNKHYILENGQGMRAVLLNLGAVIGNCLHSGSDSYSFREKKTIGQGYDHNYCLNNHGKLEKAAELSSDVSGITMEVYTDLPGLQLYTGDFIWKESGKDGVVYKKYQGVCFETQQYPDAVNHLNFPSPVVKKGEQYKSTTIYKFRNKEV